MLAAQPTWAQSSLVPTVSLVEPEQMIDVICGHGQVLVMSDGSVKGNRMTFGWVIALPTGERLAKGDGPDFCYAEFRLYVIRATLLDCLLISNKLRGITQDLL